MGHRVHSVTSTAEPRSWHFDSPTNMTSTILLHLISVESMISSMAPEAILTATTLHEVFDALMTY